MSTDRDPSFADNRTVEQLQEQLKKSEAGRSKLRENLALLREKAVNTGNLLRQYKVLQQKHEATEEELATERGARVASAQELKAAKQTIAMANKNASAMEDQVRHCKQQVEAARKAASDAAARAAKLERAHSASTNAITTLERQVAELHQRLQQPNAIASTIPAETKGADNSLAADVRHLQTSVSQLQRDSSRLVTKSQIARLQKEAEQQRAEIGRMAEQLTKWQGCFDMLGRRAPQQALSDAWVAASPSDVMLEASVREGSNMPAALPRIGSTAGVLPIRTHRGPAAADPGMLAASELGQASDEALSAGYRLRNLAAASANDLAVVSNRKRVLALVAPAAKRQRQDQLSASLPSLSASEADETGGSLAGEEEGTAADLVQMALRRLTATEEAPTLHTAQQVAQELQEALEDGAVPLALVLAGFENILLECTAPQHTCLKAVAELVPSSTADVQPVSSTSGQHASVADLRLLPMWCAVGERWRHAFALVLHCAAALSAMHAPSVEASKDAGQQEPALLLEALRRHLHEAAAQAGHSSLGHQRYFDTEACAVSAAAMLLARMLGDVQAARAFVYDLLMEGESREASMLPSLAAAVDVWPEAIPPCGKDSADAVDIMVTEFHELLQAACLQADKQSREADDQQPLASTSRSMTRLALQRVQELGVSCWRWPQGGTSA